jgi:hypothetical protein
MHTLPTCRLRIMDRLDASMPAPSCSCWREACLLSRRACVRISYYDTMPGWLCAS